MEMFHYFCAMSRSASVLVFLLFLSFSYSLVDSCIKLCFDKIENFDDVEGEMDGEEENSNEFEKDKIVVLSSYFKFQNTIFLFQNLSSVAFIPSLLTAQYAIDTPPPQQY